MDESIETTRALLAALVRAALRDDAKAEPYLAEARRLHATLSRTEALTADRLDGLWTQAVRVAEAPGEQADERRVSLTLPARCPLVLDDLTDPAFDPQAAIARVRSSAGTG